MQRYSVAAGLKNMMAVSARSMGPCRRHQPAGHISQDLCQGGKEQQGIVVADGYDDTPGTSRAKKCSRAATTPPARGKGQMTE